MRATDTHTQRARESETKAKVEKNVEFLLGKVRKYLNRKRGQIKKKNPLFGTKETGLGVTHLPLWQRPELGVGRIKIKKKTAIGTRTHTLTHICTPKTLHKHADTNTYYYYIKRNKSSVLEHIDYYYYY